MTRRWVGHLNGERYVGNTDSKHVHDLENEQTSCQIDELIRAWNDRLFTTLGGAHAAGYDNCAYCLGRSKRGGST